MSEVLKSLESKLRARTESHKYLHLFESTLVVATNLVGKE
jgi:hypothetical protein